MRKSRFTEAQIVGMIKEQEAGIPTAEVSPCVSVVVRRSYFPLFLGRAG